MTIFGLIVLLCIVSAPTFPTVTYAADGPQVFLSTREAIFVPGDRLGLVVTIQAGVGVGTRIDGYIAAQLPDGSIVFLLPNFNDPSQPPQVSESPVPAVRDFPLGDFSGIVLDMEIPPLAPGNYTLFAFGVLPGVNPLAERASAEGRDKAMQAQGVASIISPLFNLSLFATNLASRQVELLDRPRLNPVDGFNGLVTSDSVPLVLIHGFQPFKEGPRETWQKLIDVLMERPNDLLDTGGKLRVRPYFFRYSTKLGLVEGRSIEELGQRLKDQLDEQGITGPILILGHSMGGLVARSFMQDTFAANGVQSGGRVLRLITLATPHHGTPLALVGDKLFDFVSSVLSPDLVSKTLNRLRDFLSDSYIEELGWDCNDSSSFVPLIGSPECGFKIGLAGFPVRRNAWLRCLNQIQCDDTSRRARNMYLDRLIVYGGRGSTFNEATELMDFFLRMGEGFPLFAARFGDNDGAVPLESALFNSKSSQIPLGAGFSRRENLNHVQIHDDRQMLEVIVKDIKNALPPPPANQSPTITSLTPSATSVAPSGTVTLTVVASDPENDPLEYTWSATCGTPSATGPGLITSITWTAPGSPTTCTVTVSVTDNKPGHSPVSASVSITVQAVPNQPPTITSLTANPTSVAPGGTSTVTVSASDPENDPLFYTWSATCGTLSTTSGPGPVTWSAPGSVTTCTVAVSVTDNKPGHSPASASVNITVQVVSTPPPAAPTNLLAVALSASTTSLAWTDNSTNETGFKVERKIGTGGTYAQIGTQGANLNFFNDSGLAASTTYCYRVRATNDGGDSAYSNESYTTTQAAPTPAPGNFSLFTPTANCPNKVPAIHLDWSDSSGVIRYDVFRNGFFLINTATDSFFHNIVNLNFGTNYTYFIRAVGSTGLTTDSNSQSIQATCQVTVTNNSNGLNLRTCPGTTCSIITLMPDGTTMTIMGGACYGGWLHLVQRHRHARNGMVIWRWAESFPLSFSRRNISSWSRI